MSTSSRSTGSMALSTGSVSGVKPKAPKICRAGASNGRCAAGTNTYLSVPPAVFVTVFTKTGVVPVPVNGS